MTVIQNNTARISSMIDKIGLATVEWNKYKAMKWTMKKAISGFINSLVQRDSNRYTYTERKLVCAPRGFATPPRVLCPVSGCCAGTWYEAFQLSSDGAGVDQHAKYFC